MHDLERHMQELSIARKEGDRQGEGLACFKLGRYYQAQLTLIRP